MGKKNRNQNGSGLIRGTLKKVRSGSGFVERENGDDIFIHADNMKGAMNGDEVLVDLLPPIYWDKNPEGLVDRILNRNVTEVVGTYRRQKGNGFVESVGRKDDAVFIKKKNAGHAKSGDRVVCRITRYPASVYESPEGRITEIIARSDEAGAETKALIRSAGLSKDFPSAVSAQADGDFDPVIQMFFGGIAPGAYGWIMPKAGQANVGVGFSPKFSNGTLSEYFDKFVAMHGLDVKTRIEGKYVPSEGPIAKTYTDIGMVVGDAAGVVMPVNGGGIPQAMITGKLAGEVAADNILQNRSIAEYEQAWKEILYKPLKIAAGNKKLADRFAFRSEGSTAFCMKLLGKRRMGKLIRCKRLFP